MKKAKSSKKKTAKKAAKKTAKKAAKKVAKKATQKAKAKTSPAKTAAKSAEVLGSPIVPTHVAPTRFVLTLEDADNSRARGWQPPWGDLFDHPHYLTEFLGRLWTLFGPPPIDNGEGFEYLLKDTETGELIAAYTDGSGPAFGTPGGEDTASVQAIEALINAAFPAHDCAFEMGSDYGTVHLGVHKGEHFLNILSDDEDDEGDVV